MTTPVPPFCKTSSALLVFHKAQGPGQSLVLPFATRVRPPSTAQSLGGWCGVGGWGWGLGDQQSEAEVTAQGPIRKLAPDETSSMEWGTPSSGGGGGGGGSLPIS